MRDIKIKLHICLNLRKCIVTNVGCDSKTLGFHRLVYNLTFLKRSMNATRGWWVGVRYDMGFAELHNQ